MSTMAALVRAHETDARNLYVAPRSNRGSAPGRYDKRATQKSPALERRQIRDAARELGSRLPGLEGADLSDVDDYEDLQDKLDEVENDELTPPDLPEAPTIDEPSTDIPGVDPEVPEPPGPSTPPERLMLLQSGSILISDDFAQSWKVATGSPSAPIGMAPIRSGPLYVASESTLYRSTDLAAWSTINIPPRASEELSIENGDFESSTDDWDYVSGDSPRTLSSDDPPQRPGSESYLARDSFIFGNGSFAIEQEVTYISSLYEDNSQIRLSMDAYSRSETEASVEVYARTAGPPASVSPQNFSIEYVGQAGFENDVAEVPFFGVDDQGTVLSARVTRLSGTSAAFNANRRSFEDDGTFYVEVLNEDGSAYERQFHVRLHVELDEELVVKKASSIATSWAKAFDKTLMILATKSVLTAT